MIGFDRVLQHVKVISASDGHIHCEMPVQEEHLNLQGDLHIGLTVTIIDNITFYALSSYINQPILGVSTDINVTSITSAKLGDMLTIKSETLKYGSTLGYATVNIKNQHGDVVANGRQTIYLLKNKS